MSKVPSGHTLRNISQEYKQEVARKILHIGNDCVVLQPGYHLLPNRIFDYAECIYNFPARPSDVLVMSYPKTGSTWMQEIVWAMKCNPNDDHPNTEAGSYMKCPFFEIDVISEPQLNCNFFDPNGFRHRKQAIIKSYEELQEPRVFKSHLYFKLLGPKVLETAKFVYMIRNPIDACVSFFHFMKTMKSISYPDDLETFVQDYIDGTTYSGSYVEHLRQWFAMKDLPNIHTVFYESLRKNTMDELKRLNEFLNLDLSDNQLRNVEHYTSLEQMKERDKLESIKQARDVVFHESADGYFRKGEIGSGRKELSESMLEKLNNHFKKNLQGLNLPYNFD